MLANAHIDALFDAVIEATEEAILNAMLAAGRCTAARPVAYGLDPDALRAAMGSDS